MAEPSTRPDPALPKASSALADELRERILTGDFPQDAPLPPERELVAQSGMSRTTVREALRILEVQGLVRIKTGRSGGAYVQKPRSDSLASSVSLLIRGQQIRLTTLLETRESIEPQCARLAALYRTDADLRRLDETIDAMSAQTTLPQFRRLNVDWHVGVATATHNELLTGFMVALSDALFASTDNHGFLDDDVLAATVRAHRAVTRAIRDRDPAVALRRMENHVHAYAEAVLDVEERFSVELE